MSHSPNGNQVDHDYSSRTRAALISRDLRDGTRKVKPTVTGEEADERFLDEQRAHTAIAIEIERAPADVLAHPVTLHDYLEAMLPQLKNALGQGTASALTRLVNLGKLRGLMRPGEIAAARNALPGLTAKPAPEPQYPAPDADYIKLAKLLTKALLRDPKAPAGFAFGFLSARRQGVFVDRVQNAATGLTPRQAMADWLDAQLERGAALLWKPSESQPVPPTISGGRWSAAPADVARNLVPAICAVLELDA